MNHDSSLEDEPRRSAGPSAGRILAGLVAGAVAGVIANFLWGGSAALENVVRYATEPAGQVWLRALIMIVVPLVFASLTLGVAGLGDLRKLGRIGLKTLLYFLTVTLLAASLGLVMVNVIRPGVGLPSDVRERLLETYGQQAAESKAVAGEARFGIQTLVNIVPRNPLAAAAQGDMLGLIFFSLMFGVALALLPATRSATLTEALRGIGEAMVVIIDLVMKLAPFGVFALVFSVAARFGFDLLARLGWYVVTVVAGLAIFQFVVYGALLRVAAHWNPRDFFRRAWPVILTAFSTSSSNATLPTTLRVTETALGVPRNIGGFVLPLGATMNMNGTALFEGVTVLFIAQVFGTGLSLPAQGVVVFMAVLTAVGVAGVPGGSIPLLILVLEAVGLPGEGIAMVIGVDRLLDMCRTVVNVTGDMTAAVYVARSEGYGVSGGD
ncbi:MAG: dicarboxylate/amino acid:cation symporter [Acidobacteria bacterium]|nr:dicarboxylate/amino acid:cation symporter [Acidobacteriota bacterium]